MPSATPPGEPTPALEMIEAAAAAWLSLRDRGLTATETAEFVQWLQQHAQHAAVFAELDRTWKDFDRLAAVPAAEGAEPDGDLLAPRVAPPVHRTWLWTGLATAAAAMIMLLTFTHVRTTRQTVETAVGAFQKLELPDGSTAQLNTNSALETKFSAAARHVRVVRGEVFFSVAKDAARPFVVTAGPVTVRAVGTAFNVRHSDTAIEVLVTEGSVRVEGAPPGRSRLGPADSVSGPPLLSAGERVSVPVPARTDDVAPAFPVVTRISADAVQRALAWQERRLEFDAVPLAEVAREFNRYNQRQLVIKDAQLGSKRFSGTFRADGYESFVRLLEEDFGIVATRNGQKIVLRTSR